MTENSKIVTASVGVLTVLLLVGGAFIVTCVLLGALAFFCFWLLFTKSSTVRWLARRFPLTVDVVATLAAFFMMPDGITAYFAAVVMGILTTVYVARERDLHLYARGPSGGGRGAGVPAQ
jgi:hypothetical protein